MRALPSLLRRLPIPRPDLPFSKEDANRFLPWIIGILTVLTALALSAGMALNDVMVAQIAEFDQRYQIHVPYRGGEEKTTAQAILDSLPRQQGVVRVELLDDKKVANLLEPWLGTGLPLDLLPMPLILDVWISTEPLDAEAAQDALSALSSQYPDIVVERFASWVDKFNDTARNIQMVIYGVAILMLLAMVTVIILVTKASVQLHFDIVKLLHRIGAKDHYISRQFQWNAMLLTLKGTVPGTLLAALITVLCFTFVNELEVKNPVQSQGVAYAVLYTLLPLFVTFCVAFSTYMTVRHTLRRMH